MMVVIALDDLDHALKMTYRRPAAPLDAIDQLNLAHLKMLKAAIDKCQVDVMIRILAINNLDHLKRFLGMIALNN